MIGQFIAIVTNSDFDDKSQLNLSDLIEIIKSRDGSYLITVTESHRGYTATRYKYYFDCVLGLIFPHLLGRVGFYINEEFKPVASIAQFHEWLKIKYNPAEFINPETGEVHLVGLSTTTLNDREFIDSFTPQIIADFAGEPYFVEMISFEDWRNMHKSKEWNRYKSKFYQSI